MSITYPVSFPALGMARVTLSKKSVVGMSRSPFTGEQQGYVHPGQWWEASIDLPSIPRATMNQWIGFLLSLNGMEGTFTMGDPDMTAPVGTWAGAPAVNGAHAAGVTSVAMKSFSVGATVKAGDYFQTGTGLTTHLHRVVIDATADGSGNLTLEIFPRLRAALANGDTFVTSSPKGLWRLASNDQAWTLDPGGIYGGSFDVVEAL